MKIAIVVDWHSEKMGYIDNFLPGVLGSLGHEVHLITSNGQVYFNSPIYKDIFESFLGPAMVSSGVKKCDGYTLHRLPCIDFGGKVHIKGLAKKISLLKPDVVQSGEFISLATYELALLKPILGYKFFVECHVHASVFPPAQRRGNIRENIYWNIYAATIGRLISHMSEKCYPISSDAADITAKFFGVQENKIKIKSLGVDTDLFKPVSDESSKQKRFQFRKKLGFLDSDIVSIYTGRFDAGKNPLCLAKAIGKLVAQGKPFRGLFVGDGSEADKKAIQDCPGCVAHSFVPARELPVFYQASDIAVWPRQESTSQLDAAACGLPLILSDNVKVRERIEGNGFTYKEDDMNDMVYKLGALSDAATRQRMGGYGARKMRDLFNWTSIAKQYVEDYKAALRY